MMSRAFSASSRLLGATQKIPLPYGAWPSPLSTDLVLASAIALGDNYVGPKALVWTEQRPEQGGRNALVSRIDGKVQEVLQDEKWNARTRVHEYGGACAAVVGTSVVFSSVEGPLYKVDHADGAWGTPMQVSPESSVNRYADLCPHPTNPSLILAVLEDHTTDLPSAVLNSVVLLSLPTSTLHSVVSGTDFYSSPRWSAEGRMCWIQWKHPDMPWEGSELWVAEVGIKDGEVDLENVVKPGSAKKIAGEGKGVESVSQPRWVEDEDKLLFLSDRTGFYELYQWTQEGGVRMVLEEPTGADAGGPDWLFGQSTHASLAPNKWISVASKGRLRVIDLASRTSTLVDTPYQSMASLRTLSPASILVTGSPSTSPIVLAILTLGESDVTVEVLKSSSSASVDQDYISEGKPITYPTKPAEGESDDQVAYATFYEPANKLAVGLDGELPPLVVRCHGGPTSSAKTGLDWLVQFFTSRGFAFVDVNYGGSVGFGRRFRKRLDKNWGIVDVQDTIACVQYLVKDGKADAKRVAITGTSAGGFTVLAALCAGKVFGAGASLYGVSDLALLAGETHKFESHYLFNLLGGTPEEVPANYEARSPINNAAHISAPLLVLQGTADRIVLPAQATGMVETIRNAGGSAEMIMFEGEAHGFRRADSKKRATEAELAFYRKTFGIEASE